MSLTYAELTMDTVVLSTQSRCQNNCKLLLILQEGYVMCVFSIMLNFSIVLHLRKSKQRLQVV